MDDDLIKYRFGITFELFQSSYSFGTDNDPPEFVTSACFFTVPWFQQTGFTLIPYKFNSYIVQGITDIEVIRNQLKAYWITTNYKCAPFL